MLSSAKNAPSTFTLKKEFEVYIYRSKLFGEWPHWGIYVQRQYVFMEESIMNVETASRRFAFQVDDALLYVSVRSGRCQQRTNLITSFRRKSCDTHNDDGTTGAFTLHTNLVHFSLKIWQLVATILIFLLRINWPNFVQFSIQLDVLGSGLSW